MNTKSEDEDVIFTSDLFELSLLLNPEDPVHKRGIMFSFFIHPVQRAAILFEYLKSAQHEPSFHSDIATMSLLDYARDRANHRRDTSGHISLRESNFLVRSLSQVPLDVPLHGGHVAHAEQMLRKFCLVGLVDSEDAFVKSWKRIQKLFDWEGDYNCIKAFFPTDAQKLVQEDSEEYRLLAEFNEYDMMFYDNIKTVFDEQGSIPLFSDV